MTKKKKTLYNGIMATAIVIIFVVGVLIAGYLRGWFGSSQTVVTGEDGTQRVVEIVAESKKGNVNLVRNGVSFALKQGDALKDGDSIETRRGAAVTLVSGENTIYLDERSQAAVHVTEEGTVQLSLEAGGAFGMIGEPFLLTLMDTEITTEGAVFSASAPYGSAGMHIFENTASVAGQEAAAGQAVSILKDGIEITELSIQSLNSFELACAAQADGRTLCFTQKELTELAEQRQQAVADAGKVLAEGGESVPEQASQDQADDPQEAGADLEEPEEKDRTDTESKNDADEDGEAGNNPEDQGGSAGAEAEGNTGNTGGGSTGNTGNTEGGSTGNTGNTGSTGGGSQESNPEPEPKPEPEPEPEPEPAGGSCTISIVCDTILNNMDSLEEGKDGYVPSNGVILSTTSVSFSDGETVFDVLQRACGNAGIQLEYSWTPMYNSYYVEGINNLYEFDCGGQSGWMYKVNEWFPNYGCSSYTLEDGDTIVWCYTCQGLGEDVGGSIY